MITILWESSNYDVLLANKVLASMAVMAVAENLCEDLVEI